jgi:CAAX prenyl protease-like protein
MFLFLLLLALGSGLKYLGSAAFWLASPEYWIFPAQTILCGALVFYFRREYEFHAWRRPLFTIGIATVVFIIWISPQQFLGFVADSHLGKLVRLLGIDFAPRNIGFDPGLFAAMPGAYWGTICFRFLRLVVVVPLVEEIFWRGFLLRYLIAEKFEEVPLGKFSWLSFSAVTLAFCFSHSASDRVAALITGILYNCVAYRTKSLTSCILAHAITNLLLGIWIMKTRQWGFW